MPVIEPAAPLLPQSGRMVMLSRVLDYGGDWLCAEADIAADNLLVEDGELPLWAGLEILAQGIAALAGAKAQAAGEAVRLGFLLGSRRFSTRRAAVAVPCRLSVEVRESLVDDNGFAVYDCILRDGDGEVLAEAAINVFSPPNIDEMIEEIT